MGKKNPRFDSKNLVCSVCGTQRAIIHKYGLNICRRCFREVAYSIGFRKYS
ncbi:MAG: 30S ribosomal protein S14 [Candidatus Altiarchaeales archaeon]|nr:MAG: 30S ribosomal protein S14 [Candidatus Altiarchaeales archaeon]HDI72842.1 30S ribosomal protein S14 [Candidatus Altiarchaeales archaeon]